MNYYGGNGYGDRYGEKHKVFVSFYHRDDQRYKDYIDTHFRDFIVNKSVMDGEYDPDDSDEYIKRLIRGDKVSDSSVVVVLIGPHTKERKHVDWEIYAGLRASINGNSGLLGILLPEFPLHDNKYNYSDIPARLADNVESGYANIYTWDYAIANFNTIINTAYDKRVSKRNLIDNSRLQKKYNR